MRILIVHQNFLGQFRHLAAELANSGHDVLAVADEAWLNRRPSPHPAIKRIGYKTPKGASKETHPYLRNFEANVRRGQEVARLCVGLIATGYKPDVVVAHPGWGENLFLKDFFPDAKHVQHCEFFYHAKGADVGFDPEFPDDLDLQLKMRISNSTQLVGLTYADTYWSPTHWQASLYPEVLRSCINVVHEGINTNLIHPDANASFQIGELCLTAKDEVVTYVARNLEPYRGFHIFMRMLPELLAVRPAVHVLIVGGDAKGYGTQPPPPWKTWREYYLEPISALIDHSRVHFLGQMPYAEYLKVLQISSAHVYLTYPFVLSWSMLEAMAAGCLVIGSATPPVQEVLQHEENGLLCDFFDVGNWVRVISDTLARRAELVPLREAARQTIVDRYDLQTVCLPQQLEVVLS